MTMAAEKKSKALALPDSVVTLLADADKRKGFPPGTMLSMMSQEAGGNFEKFMKDPTAYHYEKNAEGKRIAGHTGKVSSAFGPFGILESTAKDPGYGVSPLKGKSFEDQLNFAADYLAGRAKSAGGLDAGIAGYGEGAKYAAQVVKRRDGGSVAVVPPASVVNASPVQVAQAVVDVPKNIVAAPPFSGETPLMGIDTPADMPISNEWVAFIKAMQEKTAAAPRQEQTPTESDVFSGIQIPDFLRVAQGMPTNLPINFTGFDSYGMGG